MSSDWRSRLRAEVLTRIATFPTRRAYASQAHMDEAVVSRFVSDPQKQPTQKMLADLCIFLLTKDQA